MVRNEDTTEPLTGLVRPTFRLQHAPQFIDAPVERDALPVNLGSKDLAVVIDAQLEGDSCPSRPPCPVR